MKLLIIAASVEALWETLKMFWDGSKVDINRIGSAILGILLCILANVDFFALVGVELSIPIVGVVLSGLLVSRGANFVHDLLKIVYEIQNQSA
jgi:hypothetical protein